VNKLLDKARENWFSLIQTSSLTHLEWMHQYLSTLSLTANAVIGLISPPLTTRRFMIDLQDQTSALGAPKLYLGFKHLVGLSDEVTFQFDEWLPALEKDFEKLLSDAEVPVHLSPCRKDYYFKAIQSLAESGQPEYVIWPMLQLWLDIQLVSAKTLPSGDVYNDFLTSLHMTEKDISQKEEALDAFLDNIELLIEDWSKNYGS
jgi:hypothetical protein